MKETRSGLVKSGTSQL